MLIVIAYDIVDNKRRREVHKLLKDSGAARQESLFECQLEPREFRRLRGTLMQLVKSVEDGLRCYIICPKCENKLPTGKIVLGRRETVIV
jgi:CRISPR-associated protein Cas2